MEVKTVGIMTLGCKVNTYESEAMAALFMEQGYQVVEGWEGADICVVNTCTVTNASDRKSRQTLRRAKKDNPDAIVVAAGCYVQVSSDDVEAMDEVDIILPQGKKHAVVDAIKAWEVGGEEAARELLATVEADDGALRVSRPATTRAFVKVQDGCRQFCSYCIIPYARGRLHSRLMQEVVEEVRELVAHGVQEVVISGIHVASYGVDTQEGDWVDLVEAIARETDVVRIRLSSMEAGGITQERLARLKATGKLCDHFHLSLQSGSDAILKAMNRHYTAAEFYDKIKLIRQVFPHAGITTDVIVGFPGETEAYFEETVQFVKAVGFSRLHVFPYSPRQGTPAAKMKGQVPGPIKKERAQRLIAVGEDLERDFIDQMMDKEVTVLLEEKHGGAMVGYAGNYLHCLISEETALHGLVTGEVVGRQGLFAVVKRR